MNERDDNQSFDPKHRIVGAVILVALAVIFLPMILNKAPEPPAVAPISELPLPDTKVVIAPVPPLEPAPDSATPVAPALERPVAAPTEPPPPTAPPSNEAQKKPDQPAKPVAVAKDKPAAKIEKGWVVQVGAFTSNENATHLRDKLRKQGFNAEIDRLSVDAKTMFRVRVGPYRDNTGAKGAQSRLQNEAGIKGVVLAYP